jgi:uncharacterized protein YPO0396
MKIEKTIEKDLIRRIRSLDASISACSKKIESLSAELVLLRDSRGIIANRLIAIRRKLGTTVGVENMDFAKSLIESLELQLSWKFKDIKWDPEDQRLVIRFHSSVYGYRVCRFDPIKRTWNLKPPVA